MKAILDLSLKDRRLACLQVEDRMRLQAASVEKDFWVCWTLRELTTLPGIGEHLTFKGGTSLSKGWGLIERFSEDIDIVVDRGMLGFGGDASPDRAPSKNQRRKRLDELVERCRTWVQGDLMSALGERCTTVLGTDSWKLEIDPDVEDGQCLLLHYPGAFPREEAGYVRPVVKIEMGARSDDWPDEAREIRPYLSEHVPALAADAAFSVATLLAERTFWEKAMLLHEETFRPDDKPRQGRLARHYYDLWCLITRGVAARAAANAELFARVREHRGVFFRQNWVDYETLQPGTLRLLPADPHRDDWRRDYERMQGPMFFGDVPRFDELLDVVGDFERRFNAAAAAS